MIEKAMGALGRVGVGELRALEAAHDAGEPMDPAQLRAWFGTVAG